MNSVKPLVMISQPMNGKSNEEILEQRNMITSELEKLGYEVLNTFYTDFSNDEKIMNELNVINKPLYYLGKSLQDMSRCSAIYFADGWEKYRGCTIEHECAIAYGLKIIHH